MGKRTTDATKGLTLEIGKRARVFRRATGWSMKQVADKLDLSITAVAEFEKGRSSSSNVLLGYVGLGFPASELEEVCRRVFINKVFRPPHGSRRGDHLPGGLLPAANVELPAGRSPEAATDHDVEGAGDRS